MYPELGAEHLLADHQRPLKQRPGTRKVALGLKQASEVIEAVRDIRMLGAERLLTDRQRCLEERRARARSPCLASTKARLLRLCATSGCSGPRAFSRIASACAWSDRASGSDTDDAMALAVGALVTAHLGKDYDTALRAIERALSLNPSSAIAHFFGAQLHSFRGNPEVAVKLGERALRLSPFN